MAKLFKIVFAISKVLHGIAAIALTLMIAVTVVDVFLRTIGQAVVGAYEVIGMICGPLVVGFAVPLSSWDKKHISMDIVLSGLSLPSQKILMVATRIICILLFFFMGYNLFSVGNVFRTSGEVSQMLHIPFYWVTYGVAICCFVECMVFVCDIIKIAREER
jgi:TRAP-type C4-dicarboxylate transport system permease small subunit